MYFQFRGRLRSLFSETIIVKTNEASWGIVHALKRSTLKGSKWCLLTCLQKRHKTRQYTFRSFQIIHTRSMFTKPLMVRAGGSRPLATSFLPFPLGPGPVLLLEPSRTIYDNNLQHDNTYLPPKASAVWKLWQFRNMSEMMMLRHVETCWPSLEFRHVNSGVVRQVPSIQAQLLVSAQSSICTKRLTWRTPLGCPGTPWTSSDNSFKISKKNKFEIISKSWLNLIFEHFEHFEHLDICLKSFRITFGQEAREELERTRCHAEATERTQLFSAQFSYTDFSSWFLPSIGTAWPIWCLCVSYCLIDQVLQVPHMCCIIRRYKYKSSIAYDFLWSCRSW